MKVWKLMILEVEQKAIAKFGKKKYISLLAILSHRSEDSILFFFTLNKPPSLSIYAELLMVVEKHN